MSEINVTVLMSQLLAMRAAIEGLANQVDAVLSVLCPVSSNVECNHPKDKRQNLSTMGIERWKCRECGYIYEEKREGGG